MNKYYKCFIIILFFVIALVGCTNTPDEPDDKIDEHNCEDYESDWIDDEEFTCLEKGYQHTICTKCGELISTRKITKYHNYEERIIKQVTCTENGEIEEVCLNCGKTINNIKYATGHIQGDVVVTKEQTSSTIGQMDVMCSVCNESIRTLDYVNNGYFKYGELKVDGRDLVSTTGSKVQLYGLSTHGMQWFGRYANFDTIASFKETFGINIIRFAFYTSENGYCDGDESKKAQMLEDLKEGVDAATSLGLYVIIDWHMVGAEDVNDKNPLTYLEESKEFFSYISEYYKTQNNILYEIMNEPNGSTTWSDCKKYAEEVIPCIRKNSNAIILVGNPKWTADLNSVMKDPLVGYNNIMYTYHFYAADRYNTSSQVIKAYDSGFPVFISEFGFMDSDGDGDLDLSHGESWRDVLDERNISYVAWNISNSGGSASIFKQDSDDMIDVSDSNLKEWGIYLKKWYRSKSKLDQLSK